MTRGAIALEALERIAARGIMVRDVLSEPPHARWEQRVFRCRLCNKFGQDGVCADRDCPSAIARNAILDIRRAS